MELVVGAPDAMINALDRRDLSYVWVEKNDGMEDLDDNGHMKWQYVHNG